MMKEMVPWGLAFNRFNN